MSILNEIRNAICSVTEDGLNFECLEVSCVERVITSYRIYRSTSSMTRLEDVKLPQPLEQFVQTYTRDKSGIRLLDYSIRENGKYSLSFLVDEGIHVPEKQSGNLRQLKLTNVGFLIEQTGQVAEMKEYYSLDKENEIILNVISNEKNRTIREHGYDPFMYGVNRGEESSEEKIYYMNLDTSIHRYEQRTALALYEALEMPKEMDDITKIAYENKLWLRGFAYGCNGWRYYFFKK